MSDRASKSSVRGRRGPNLPLTILAAIYIVALITAAVLYFIGLATLGSDPRGAAGYFLFGNAIGALGALGGMLHLAVAAVRNVIEDNAR